MGRRAEAEVTYRQALSLKPDDTGVLNNLALALKDNEQFDEASAHLTRSLSIDQDNPKTLTYLALVRVQQKRVPEAEVAAQRAVMLARNDPDALNVMGLVRFEQQESEEALALYRRAIALKPDLLQLHGKETPERVAALRGRFRLPVMKALPVERKSDLAAVRLYEKVADRILFGR